jgi:hypothetical protein
MENTKPKPLSKLSKQGRKIKKKMLKHLKPA